MSDGSNFCCGACQTDYEADREPIGWEAVGLPIVTPKDHQALIRRLQNQIKSLKKKLEAAKETARFHRAVNEARRLNMTLHPKIRNKTQGRERRFKGVLIDPRHLVFVTMGPRNCEYLSLMYEDIPQDAEVIEVSYDWTRQSFVMSLWHESFDIVPDGHMMPIHFAIKVNVVRHLCCQPIFLKHEFLPNGHDELFNQFIATQPASEELDSWIKEYEKAYGVHYERGNVADAEGHNR